MSGMDNAIFECEFRYRLQPGGFVVRSRDYDALKAFRQHVQFATRAEECGFTVKPASEFDIDKIAFVNYSEGGWGPMERIWPRKTPEKASPETPLPSFLISGSPRELP